jgi:threonine dehydrogenase-like Zn-dependent dehydrogenase
MVVGHEFVGEIVEVGSNVTDFRPGDVVSGEGHVICGRCRNCLAGRRHLCADTKGIGVNRPGAFAEYLALPMHLLTTRGCAMSPNNLPASDLIRRKSHHHDALARQAMNDHLIA